MSDLSGDAIIQINSNPLPPPSDNADLDISERHRGPEHRRALLRDNAE